MSITTILSAIDSFIWGPPLLILLVGTGLYLTLRLGFLQIRYLPRALRYLFQRDANKGKGDVSSFAALCTALAATIGILWGWRPPFKPVALAQFFGCGWWLY